MHPQSFAYPLVPAYALRYNVHMDSKKGTEMTIETTARQSDAHGGHCATCNVYFNITTCPYWAWSKSVWMHRGGTGHKVSYYKIAR